MPIFSDTFRQNHQGTGVSTWVTSLLESDPDDAQKRFELAMRQMAPPVSHAILERIGSDKTSDVLGGLAMFWSVCMAGVSGWKAESCGSSGVIVKRNDDTMCMNPVVCVRPLPSVTQSTVQQRLIHNLQVAIPGRRFVVHFKRPIPNGFDPLVVVTPVQNWLGEIERGQWSGGYAIYEDADVSLELCLVDQEARDETGRMLFYIPPLRTELLMRDSIPDLVRAAQFQTGEIPQVLVPICNQPWGCNPAMLLSILYGRCIQKDVGEDQQSVHLFSSTGPSLFSNETFQNTAAIWWLAPGRGNGQLYSGFAHRNPWYAGQLPGFVGRTFDAESVTGHHSTYIVTSAKPEVAG